MPIKICIGCNEEYNSKVHPKKQKYCSLKCFANSPKQLQKASNNGTNNYHSLKEWQKNNDPWNKQGLKRICLYCNKTFKVHPYKIKEGKAKYCSVKCYRLAAFNPNTDENRRIRNSTIYKIWRKQVFERDNFTCQKCLTRPENRWVEAHHIAHFELIRKAKIPLGYGITLCRPCHLAEHGKKLKGDKSYA